MPPGRNDPCPCGSGRRYKRCCLRERRAFPALEIVRDPNGRDSTPADGVPPADTAWQVDLVPLPAAIDDDPDARPAAVLITAGDYVLHIEFESRPPAEPEEVAGVLAEAVRKAATKVGHGPQEVRVRHPEVAAALRHLGLAGAPRVVRRALGGLDRAASSLIASLTDSSPDRPVGLALRHSWKAWGLSSAAVAELFGAAAAFHRAAPWRQLGNEDLLEIETRAGRRWTASVMGAAGEEFGAALYEDRRDVERFFDQRSPARAFANVRRTMLSLTFARRDELPPPMRKEVLSAGWEVAAPDAYPILIVLNTPGGGITPSLAAEMVTAFRSIARFAGRAQGRGSRGSHGSLPWKDAESGATVAVVPLRDAAMDNEVELLATLRPALAVGPGADPEAGVEARDPAVLQNEAAALLARFATSLEGGLSDATIRTHVMNAELFLEFLATTEGIPLAAVTEYDLRVFLHDWYPRKVLAPLGEMRRMPVSLKRFFRFAAGNLGLALPWAAPILDDRARFEDRLTTVPDPFGFDAPTQDWIMEVTVDLAMREFLPDDRQAGGGRWADLMGDVEYDLHRELRRRWLVWRDALIASGVVEPAAVREELVRQQRAWETTMHPDHGLTPVAAVARERKASRRG